MCEKHTREKVFSSLLGVLKRLMEAKENFPPVLVIQDRRVWKPTLHDCATFLYVFDVCFIGNLKGRAYELENPEFRLDWSFLASQKAACVCFKYAAVIISGPKASGGGSCLPNYPGFELDVLKVVGEFFSGLGTAFVPSHLIRLFYCAFGMSHPLLAFL